MWVRTHTHTHTHTHTYGRLWGYSIPQVSTQLVLTPAVRTHIRTHRRTQTQGYHVTHSPLMVESPVPPDRYAIPTLTLPQCLVIVCLYLDKGPEHTVVLVKVCVPVCTHTDAHTHTHTHTHTRTAIAFRDASYRLRAWSIVRCRLGSVSNAGQAQVIRTDHTRMSHSYAILISHSLECHRCEILSLLCITPYCV